ncbi:MAG: LysR substrate-binding domain-containing protein, partial [Burkholderiales bacterium]
MDRSDPKSALLLRQHIRWYGGIRFRHTGSRMNLHHIEAVSAVVAHDFNISAAGAALSRSQPTLSRQIQQLERALGVRIFVRTRNKVVALTPTGEEILRIGQRIALDVRHLKHIAQSEDAGPKELRIATTHLHARYTLLRVMKTFASRFGDVVLTLQQGDPKQCGDLVARGEADIGFTTFSAGDRPDIAAIPTFRLSRSVIVPRDHPLTREKTITLKKLAAYPLVAYSAPFSGRRIVEEAFARAGINPRIVCSTIDADVSKTYVEAGMGIAVLASVSFDPARDRGLVAIDAGHLFESNVMSMLVRKRGYLGRFAREFVSMLAPHVSPAVIRDAVEGVEL